MPRDSSGADAVAQAVALLAGRERTRAELVRALAARGRSEAEIALAVERVASLGYLDDQRVAAARAERLLSSGWGRAEVRRRLVSQGIAEGVAGQAVAEAAEALGQLDEASARALIAAKHLEGLRAARFLARRGFDEGLIRRLVGLDGD
jgi:regulatory protein